MSLSAREISQLRELISIATKMLELAEMKPSAGAPSRKPKANAAKTARRSGKEVAAFRKMLKAERKRGAPVADLAREHGVTTSYIYQLK